MGNDKEEKSVAESGMTEQEIAEYAEEWADWMNAPAGIPLTPEQQAHKEAVKQSFDMDSISQEIRESKK